MWIIVGDVPIWIDDGDNKGGPDLPELGPWTYALVMIALVLLVGWEFYMIFGSGGG